MYDLLVSNHDKGGDSRFALCLSIRPSVCLSVHLSHLFSGLFLIMLSHIWMKVGSKLLYEELQNKFDFPPVDLLFPELCPFSHHTHFPDFSCLCFHISGWKLVASFYMKNYRSSFTSVMVDLLFPELLPIVRHTHFPDFSLLCFHVSGWKLVASFYMKSYRSSSTSITVDLLLCELLSFICHTC